MALVKCPECGNQVSDKATSCPQCGCPLSEIKKPVTEEPITPKTPPNSAQVPLKTQTNLPKGDKQGKKQLGTVLVVIGVIVVLIIANIIGKRIANPPPHNAISITRYYCDYCKAEVREDTVHMKTKLEERVFFQPAQYTYHEKCRPLAADSLYKLAVNKLKDIDKKGTTPSGIGQASVLVLKAKELGYPVSEELLAKIAVIKEKADREWQAMIRLIYSQSELKDYFLEQAMDVYIKVTGKENDVLILKYSLFGNVWVGRFADPKYKEHDLYDKLKKEGFKEVIFTDGFNYRRPVAIY